MYQPQDIYEVTWIHDLELSPDGRYCAYVLRRARGDGAGYVSALWVQDLDTESAQCLTGSEELVSTPRWSPQGTHLAYVSNRQGGNQIWLVPSDGGTARCLTQFDGGASDPAWSPDGQYLAGVGRVPALDQGQDDEIIPGPRPRRKVVRRLWYKFDGGGWWDGRYSQIFRISLSGEESLQLTRGDFNHHSPRWSPQGHELALVANRSEDADYHHHADLWVVPAEGGTLTQLTSSIGPVASEPVWSPQGDYLAYLGHDNRYERSTCMALYVVSRSGKGREQNLLQDFPYPATGMVISDMVWSRSGLAPSFTRQGDLLFVATISGSQQIFRISRSGGEPQPLTPPGQVVYDLSYSPVNGRLAFLVSRPDSIGALEVLEEGAAQPRPSWPQLNQHLAQRPLALPERVVFTGVGGDEVESWLYKPPDFQPDRKYPLVLFIHSGSSPCYGYAFMLDFQILAADGFIVFAPNQRGSQGYGQERAASIRHQWCGPDYEDLMLGVDHVAQLPYVDEQRLGVTGASFGGLMTNWIITHSQRFAAAIPQASTSNRFSNYGTCDVGWRIADWIYPCAPWDDVSYYMDRSPVVYAQQVNAPVLFLHGEEDYRCNLEQAEQFYRALKVLRKCTELVIFEGEPHEVRRPFNRVERYRQIRRWFRKYLKR